MTDQSLSNLRIDAMIPLLTPCELKSQLQINDTQRQTVQITRDSIGAILNREDPRLLVITGPCSIHDPIAAIDYAKRLKVLAEKHNDSLLIVMRVYFEKPRTTTGWKGLINDPDLNDSFDIEKGLQIARKLLLDITDLGLGIATEALDPISPQYLQDLIAWSAIGARTSESQTHREMASGLSTPVGFKNGTDGSLDTAICACRSAQSGHRFLGITPEGKVAIVSTTGNELAHVVLRGGGDHSNYDHESIASCEAAMQKANLPSNIVVDCSHANSNKDHNRQSIVLSDVTQQIQDGNHSIIGVMLESHIEAGRQDIPGDLSELKYGQSVTDACIDWATTELLIEDLGSNLQDNLVQRQRNHAKDTV